MHLVASVAAVPPVPPAPHSSLVANLSVFFIVSGIALVLSALSPVRRAVREAVSRANERVAPKATPVRSAAPVETTPAPTPARREIETFDLDIFS